MYCSLSQKADRRALEGKASREWVDSTFERLDQQIREARDKLVGQEEALRSAVTQLNEDVETKLDRLELEPLKEYFGRLCVCVCACVWYLLLTPLLCRQEAGPSENCPGSGGEGGGHGRRCCRVQKVSPWQRCSLFLTV